MGTRGMFGLVIDEEVKASYNQFDSYPAGKGLSVLEFAHALSSSKDDYDKVKQQARDLIVVSEEQEPTQEQIEKLRVFSDTLVSTGELTEWYVLLRRLQGDLVSTLEAGVILDASHFARDSLFCEWGYLINLDDDSLEVYEGFQKEPHVKGRFSGFDPLPHLGQSGDYYPIALVASWSLAELPDPETFVRELEKVR